MPLFITFEGGEGSGKSSQARALYRRLDKLAVPVLLTHEPGVTKLGKSLTRLIKWAKDTKFSPVAELLLFNTSRAQLVAEIIKPALDEGKVVICDRYFDSTTAYQGYGRGLDLKVVAAANETGSLGLKPKLTVLLDIPVEDGLARKKGNKDRFEQENLAFHRRVREGYIKLAKAEPRRWLVVDSRQSKAKIAQIIWQRVSQLLSKV
ncbi:MAG: dTMP kinase [Dehalococcoidales bacterium]|nr:dTMP kinase [Dehalococcoidales bacterium]